MMTFSARLVLMLTCTALPASLSLVTGCGAATPTASPQPRSAAATAGPFVAIDAGRSHTCALHVNGRLLCWGDNFSGQLGTGDRDTPRQARWVEGLTDVATFEVDEEATCATRRDGQHRCWGYNGNGGGFDVGHDRLYVLRPEPAERGSLRRRSSGHDYACSRADEGRVQCWGGDARGMPNTDLSRGQDSPVTLDALENITVVDNGTWHACAIDEDAALWCWGANQFGQVDGTLEGHDRPVRVELPGPVDDVALGDWHTCAVSAGEVYCWGQDQENRLGTGALEEELAVVLEPTPIEGLAPSAQLSLGEEVSCSRSTEGRVSCWGNNRYQLFGAAPAWSSAVPVDVPFPAPVEVLAVASGMQAPRFLCALLTDGSVQCRGKLRPLGEPAEPAIEHATLRTLEPPVPLTTLAASEDRLCGIGEDGAVVCWGWEWKAEPVWSWPAPAYRVELDAPIVALELGYHSACAVTERGDVTCWGFGDDISKGPTLSDWAPPELELEARRPAVLAVGRGSYSSVVASDGAVWSWDAASAGELSHPTGMRRAQAPHQVADAAGVLDDLVALDATTTTLCGVRSSGRVVCWGTNTYGELANGDTGWDEPPAEVAGIDDAADVAVSYSHVCVRTGDGAVQCWGKNSQAQAGRAPTRDQPVALPPPPPVPSDADLVAHLDSPPTPREGTWREGDHECREFWNQRGEIVQHCVERPEPPCDLVSTGATCRRQRDCGDEGVCWYAQCVAAPAERPTALGQCLAGVVELDYGGASPDRVYAYGLHASVANIDAPEGDRHLPTREWSEPVIVCHDDVCGTYELGGSYLSATGHAIQAAGESDVTVYIERASLDAGSAPPLWTGAQTRLALRWRIDWPFSQDDPERFASRVDARWWQLDEGAACVDETRYQASLPAKAVTLEVEPTSVRRCESAP